MNLFGIKIKSVLLKYLFVSLFWLMIWQLIALIAENNLLIPSPLNVINRLFVLAATAKFWQATLFSLLRIIAGYLAGIIVASVLAIFTSKLKAADALAKPLLIIIKSTPVASFIILTLVFMKTDIIPAFIAFLIVLPIMWQNVAAGIAAVPIELEEMVRIFDISFKRRFFKLYLPSVLPYFKAGCLTTLGLAWKAGVAAEVLCRPRLSIGRYLYDAKIYLETVDLFAWTLTVVIMSLLLEIVVMRIFGGKHGKH